MNDITLTAHLPGLDLILSRRPGTDQLVIGLKPTPPFEALARMMSQPLTNPWTAAWTEQWIAMAQTAWAPWLAFMALPTAKNSHH